jgi:glycosyl transferase family 2
MGLNGLARKPRLEHGGSVVIPQFGDDDQSLELCRRHDAEVADAHRDAGQQAMTKPVGRVRRLEQGTLRATLTLREDDLLPPAVEERGHESRHIVRSVFAVAVHHDDCARAESIVRGRQADRDRALMSEVAAECEDVDRLERVIRARAQTPRRGLQGAVVNEPDGRTKARLVQCPIEVGGQQRGGRPIFENWNDDEEPCVDGGAGHGVSVLQSPVGRLIEPPAPATLHSLKLGPVFSVAVPIRDHVDFLETALRSIEAQGVDTQVAVLDASVDERAQQILAGHCVRAAYGYHHADAGQAAAIQDGWNQTSGGIVAWLNADDFYFPNALDCVAAMFEARPDVDVVFGHAVHVSAEGDFLSYFPAIDPDPRSLTRGCVICQPSCFVRRRAMERVGGLDTALHYTMDWDLWLRLYRAGCRFAFMDAPLSAVRVHAATKTMSRAPARYREIRSLLARAGISWFGRLRTLGSFYAYDLENRRTGLPDRVIHGLTSTASRAYRRLRARRSRVVQGIECWTNLVRGDCRVDVPWFGGGSTADITVISDRPIDLAFAAGSSNGTLDARGSTGVAFQGATIRGHQYTGRVPVVDRRLSIGLSAAPSPWRLLRMSAA